MTYKLAIDPSRVLAELFGTGEDEECIRDLVRASDWAANIQHDLNNLPDSVEDLEEHLYATLEFFDPRVIAGIYVDMERSLARLETDINLGRVG